MTTKVDNAQWARLVNHSVPLEEWVDKSIFPHLRPYAEATEIVSEAMRYAYEHPDQWENIPDDRLINYLKRIANYLLWNRARRLKVHREVMRNQQPEPDKELSPSKKIHQRDKVAAMNKIFSRMKYDSQKEILKLVWLDGLKVKEAARTMKRSPKAASMLLRRALESCRQIARADSFAGFRISGETR